MVVVPNNSFEADELLRQPICVALCSRASIVGYKLSTAVG